MSKEEDLAIVHALDGDLEGLKKVLPELGENAINIVVDDDGSSLLLCAATFNRFNVVKYLLEHGANIEDSSRDYTPLQVAAEEGFVDIVALLLSYGANLEGELKRVTNENLVKLITVKMCQTCGEVSATYRRIIKLLKGNESLLPVAMPFFKQIINPIQKPIAPVFLFSGNKKNQHLQTVLLARGVHFYTNKIDKKERIWHRKCLHIMRDVCSSLQQTDASEIARKETQKSLRKIYDEIPVGKKRKLHQLYTNSSGGFFKALREGSFGDEFKFGSNPISSWTYDIEQALRYSYGLKAPSQDKPSVLKPQYNSDGEPAHTCVGAFYLAFPEKYESLGFNVCRAHYQGDVKINPRILGEREHSLIGSMPAHFCFAEGRAIFPSFTEFTSTFKEKYGFSEKEFTEIKRALKRAKSAVENDNITLRIIEVLVKHQAEKLITMCHRYANKLGKIIVHPKIEGFSADLEPESFKKIRQKKDPEKRFNSKSS